MREKTVVLTVGPQGSGKSTFCDKIIANNQDITLISRDRILIDLVGSTYTDSYCVDHEYALEIMWKKVRSHLRESPHNIILDTWNGCSEDRNDIIKCLRNLGVETIIAWYFITPVQYVERWFWEKPEVARTSEMRSKPGRVYFSDDVPAKDYELFHRLALNIENNGFDEIIRINPLQLEDFTLKTGLEI